MSTRMGYVWRSGFYFYIDCRTDTRRTWRTEIIGGLVARSRGHRSALRDDRFLPGGAIADGSLAETGGVSFCARVLTPIGPGHLQLMLVALTVHIKKGFFAQNGGYEYTLYWCRSVKFCVHGQDIFHSMRCLEITSVHILASPRCWSVSLWVFSLIQRTRHRQQTHPPHRFDGSQPDHPVRRRSFQDRPT